MTDLPENIDPHFARYLKMVVAVTIIRRRPPGITGKQHAERLCTAYQQSLLSWKKRAESLEEEVLLLQQAVVRSELLNSRMAKNEGEFENVSEDGCQLPEEFGGRSKRCVTTCWQRVVSQRTDSSSVTGDQLISVNNSAASCRTNDLKQIKNCAICENNVEKSALSGNFVEKVDKCDVSESGAKNAALEKTALNRHVVFLQTILSLGALGPSSHAMQSSSMAKRDVDTVMLDTAKSVLDTLVDWFCSLVRVDGVCDSLITDDIADKAVAIIARLAQDRCGDTARENHSIVDLVLMAVESLLAAVIDNSTLNSVSLQRRLCSCILRWSQVPRLRVRILFVLLQTLEDCSAVLRNSTTLPRYNAVTHGCIKPHLLENIVHVFWSAEQILNQELTCSAVESCMDQNVCVEALVMLENAVLHLSDSAVMFCYYAWKIMALIDGVRLKYNSHRLL